MVTMSKIRKMVKNKMKKEKKGGRKEKNKRKYLFPKNKWTRNE